MVHVVISGPGGVGKGTLVGALLERNAGLWLSRSWTTRERRPGEAEDAYVFTDRETFDANIAADGFLEWVEFLDYRQGTPKPNPPDDVHVVFEIDIEGARAIREWDPEALLIFVDAPERAEQRRRLVERGDSEERIAARMKKGDEERAKARELGCHWVVNDVLDDAVGEVEALIVEASLGALPPPGGSR